MWLLVVLLFWGNRIASGDPVFYRSKVIPLESLEKQPGEFEITDDKGKNIRVDLLLHKDNGGIYWYRRLLTEVCLTGECRPIDIGIYWTGNGKYLGIEVFGENLTKTDHSDFSEFDYRKLEAMLKDEWSPLREFLFDELVDPKKDGVDATTGATKKVIADASVKDAVYTTYTMWHLIHVGEDEQLALLTYRYLKENAPALSAFLRHDEPEYVTFLLEGVTSGNLPVSPGAVSVVLKALKHPDPSLRNFAFRAINLLPLASRDVQDELAPIYKEWAIQDKNRFLQSAAGLETLHESLYSVLASDLGEKNAWFLSALIPVLAASKIQSAEVVKKIKELEKSGDPQLKNPARKFLQHIGRKSEVGSRKSEIGDRKSENKE
ncbi:hypothetical protein GCM10023091_02680 [Ravibacter arvi]|uniref:HEAT repeat domain-containing protein n=1 Tax=Ravibacter arvi TaxID=2051041 RepID=A0ABP8LNB1_9BACT